MAVKIKYVTVGRWKENCYLIESSVGAWLVDPGDNFALIDEEFKIAEKNIHGIINTHGHFDHLGAVHEFKAKYNLRFYLHSKDKQLVRQANLYRGLAGDKTVFTTPEIDVFLDDILYLPIDEKKLIVHYTPGHSHGGVCFEIDQSLISGDTLFSDKMSRTDLPGGNPQLLRISINYIFDHFAGYTIYPGHGDPFILDESVIKKIRGLL